MNWLDSLAAACERDEAVVLVSVARTRGSAPREAGTHMVVGADWVHGTIGGGHLEYKAIAIAREQLVVATQLPRRSGFSRDSGAVAAKAAPTEASVAPGGASLIRRFPLGASLGQCCGGVVELLFEAVPVEATWPDALREAGRDAVLVTAVHGEAGSGKLLVTADGRNGGLGDDALDAVALQRARDLLASGGKPALVDAGGELHGRPAVLFFEPLPASTFHVVLFGAGHVGRALVQVLAPLADRITWVDPRAEEFPADLPPNVEAVVSEFPEDEVDAAAPGAWFVVMTHDHGLDQRLSERILRRGDAGWFGLIGSRTKRRAFEQRLMARGVEASRLKQMTCPIGVDGIRDKHPGAIAIAVAAQMLQQREATVALRALRQA